MFIGCDKKIGIVNQDQRQFLVESLDSLHCLKELTVEVQREIESSLYLVDRFKSISNVIYFSMNGNKTIVDACRSFIDDLDYDIVFDTFKKDKVKLQYNTSTTLLLDHLLTLVSLQGLLFTDLFY